MILPEENSLGHQVFEYEKPAPDFLADGFELNYGN